MVCGMNRLRGQSAPWWLMIQLWGLDAPLAALCWGGACAELLEIPVLAPEMLLLLAFAVWFITLSIRLCRALVLRRGWYVQYYRSHTALFSIFIICAALVTLWLLLCAVGHIVFLYAVFPLMMLLLGYMPFLSRSKVYRGLCHASSFALACMVPATVFGITVSPWEMLTFSPTWYLTFLMFLYYIARSSWMQAEDAARRQDTFVNVGSFALIACCLLNMVEAPALERPLFIALALGAASLELLVRLRPRLSQDELFAFSWLAMALPPVVGLLVL